MRSVEPPMQRPETVFFDGLQRYSRRGVVRFHTPGHRGGRWLHPAFGHSLGDSVGPIDVSDVLEGPSASVGWDEALRQAERNAADVFGAGATRFLVNGSSGGIHVAIGAIARNSRVAFSRASHLSVYAGCILHRSEPIYLDPVYDPVWDIPGPPRAKDVADVLHRGDLGAYVETSPTYFGLAPELPQITPHRAHLLVDEAHGSHFPFCPGAPPPALQSGCSVSVQSFHKTLGALTQASVLHVSKGAKGLVPHIDRMLTLLQTTSASPILLASLESAVAQAAETGLEDWRRATKLAADMRSWIDQNTNCRCLTAAEANERWGSRMDPARLVINLSETGWSGLAALRWLRTNHNLQLEMANQRAVVALISPGNTSADGEALLQGIRALSRTSPAKCRFVGPPLTSVRPKMLPWKAVDLAHEALPLKSAVGRVAAEMVCPYPPGIPLLAPGEEITSEVVEYLEHVQREGWEVRGPADPDLRAVAVVK